MANDTPFVELPSPPASPSQPAADADIRGTDNYGPLTGDEYQKAVAYAASIRARVLSKNRFLLLLSGNKKAYRALLHKTLPLAESSPPHYDGP